MWILSKRSHLIVFVVIASLEKSCVFCVLLLHLLEVKENERVCALYLWKPGLKGNRIFLLPTCSVNSALLLYLTLVLQYFSSHTFCQWNFHYFTLRRCTFVVMSVEERVNICRWNAVNMVFKKNSWKRRWWKYPHSNFNSFSFTRTYRWFHDFSFTTFCSFYNAT